MKNMKILIFLGMLFSLGQAMAQSIENKVESLEKQINELRSIVEVENDKNKFPVQAGWDDGFYLSSDDNKFRLNIGGHLEPRYEYTRVTDESFVDDYPEIDPLEWEPTEDLSSFDLRRIRLDFSGHIGSENLTFRLRPEFAGGSTTLRDGWIQYEFSPKLKVRFGQKSLPFQWHRFVSSSRQYFVERNLVSRNFGYPKGRDVGLLIHGKNDKNTLYYALGVYDGAGRNIGLSTSKGNVLTGRVGYSFLGELPKEEPDLSWSKTPKFSLGIGVQAANRSEIRDWDLGRSMVGNTRADWISGTIDGRFAWRGFSFVGEFATREVKPDDYWVKEYSGYGYSLSSGYMIIPDTLGLVGRYGKTFIDEDVDNTEETEWGIGLNLYHNKHDWKTQLQYLNHEVEENQTHSIILQHTLSF